mgnify:CR=1 FL=1
MKVILKIDEYIQEKNSVVVKTCRLYSHKSIDEFGAKVVNCDDLNMTDCESFIESLVNKVSQNRIDSQDEKQGILESNKPVEITGELDFEKIIGVVIQGRVSRRNRILKMRRIEL